MKNNRFVQLIKEQPLLFILAAVCLVGMILLIIFGSRQGQRTDGDLAAPDSGAFLVYEDKVFKPTNNFYSDELVREDVASYARQTIEDYDPAKNPTVIFNVSEVEGAGTGNVKFSGTYEKFSEDIDISVEVIANQRIKTSIISRDKKTEINDRLPSNSPFNRYVATLPIEGERYYIDFNFELGTIQLSVYDRSTELLQSVYNTIKGDIGETFEDSMVNVTFPPPENQGLEPGPGAPTIQNEQGETIYIESS